MMHATMASGFIIDVMLFLDEDCLQGGVIMLKAADGWFIDETGRRIILRGCNLGGDCKVPFREGNGLVPAANFLDWQRVSFTGRPLPLDEAETHLDRLQRWGFNVVRLLVTWEGLEPAGPDQYDDVYYEYIEQIVDLSGHYGLRVFVDPHQDVWSRWTGGDGAPAWTLDLAGFDLASMQRSGAAFVHELAGDPYPRMLWPANYSRLACATMFTLFFAGDVYAPSLRIAGQGIGSFLQDHYIAAVARLAGRLARFDHVMGLDTLNEPSEGFIGLDDLSRLQRALSRIGPMPSPFQAMMAGSGFPVEVPVYGLGLGGQVVKGHTMLGEHGTSVWKTGSEDIWRREGVWDEACGKPVLRRPDYFSKMAGKTVHFENDILRPFMRRIGQAISQAAGRGRFMLFLEAVPNVGQPQWNDDDTRATGLVAAVNASHWYDGLTLVMKRWTGFLAYDTERGQLVFGASRIRRYFCEHLGRIRQHGQMQMAGAPTIIGEFGLPFDMNDARAFRTGDYQQHVAALSAYYAALDANLLSATIWNYTASNTHARGDGWNGEDLSIWNRDDFLAGRSETAEPADAGGRAMAGFVRPYARAVAGQPLLMRFKPRQCVFICEFRPDPTVSEPTEIYVPDVHYPNGCSIAVRGGEHHVVAAAGYRLVRVKADPGVTLCRVSIRKR
jgi:hypothetical protein